MKKKILHIDTLNEISNMVNKVKNLNETISFDENCYNEEDEFLDDEDMNDEEEMSHECETTDDCDIDEMNDIDRIREIALKGMLKYVKNTGSSEYETLKKIFQFCDKVNNEKTEEIK